MTAVQLTKAYLVAGTSLGDLQLDAQAFDSSGLPDNSGTSSLVRLKFRVVSSAAGVTVGTDGQLQLVEGVSTGSAGYEESLTFKLKEAPAAGEVVTLRLVDTDKQFLLSKTALTFTADNYGTDQTVQVRAVNDGAVEGASQKARLNFSLASNSGSSAYTGLSVDQLNFVIADPSNTAATGALTLTSQVTQGDTLTIDTSAIADVDGLGTLNYQWERSKGGITWTSIANASEKSYTLAPADAASKVRVVVSFIDGKGNAESIKSTVTDNVVGGNVSPTSRDTFVAPAAKAGLLYSFKPVDFPFVDLNEGDALSSVILFNVSSDSLLRYNGEKITTGTDGFEITRANLPKLTFTVPSGKSASDTLGTLSFKVSDASGGSSDVYSMNLTLGEWSGVYGASAASGLELSGFSAYAKTTGLNSRMQSPVGVDLSLVLASGSTKGSFDVNVDSNLNANGYWVKDSAGFWVNLATDVKTTGDITTLSVQLEDGKYDSDATLGVVSDSGVIAQMPLSVVGITPDATEDGLWF
jgi:hypothetical protein